MPFVKRQEREVLVRHRPFQFEGPSVQSLAEAFKSKIYKYDDWKAVVDQYKYFLVCGSNLIDKEFANSAKIYNVHSGLIPAVRGLDSFKWAILNNKPIGNTLHKINEEPDAGVIISHLKTPVFPEDDIATFARRHYENEIFMLCHFFQLVKNGIVEKFSDSQPTMRMSIATEAIMVRGFDDYKKHHAFTSASHP